MTSLFEATLLSAFPTETWSPLVFGLSSGIKNADTLIETTPMLRHTLGRDLQGHIRRIGILTALETMCSNGQLPFSAGVSPMPKGVWHWMDIKSGKSVAHVARTISAKSLPEDTPNRQPLRLKNTYDLFTDGRIPDEEEVIEEAKVWYSYVTFGADRAGTLTHACIGMPSSDDTGWLAFFNILPRKSSFLYSPPPSPQQPDPTGKLKLKRSVEEFLEGNEGDQEKLA